MSLVIDAKWLLLVPLIPAMAFVMWVLWNLSREIWSERRTYGRPAVRTLRTESRTAKVHHPNLLDRRAAFDSSEEFAISYEQRREPVDPPSPRHRPSLQPERPSRARSQS